ncbi:hypothetical protein [Rhizobium mongolense]|uniref:hypothetical protein n=1 Tax=Rhizobium mongolense TaxID=57676 RepID=UPI0035565D60
MSTPALDRKLLAILAADMVGYSKAMEADEAGTVKRLRAIRADLINPAISQPWHSTAPSSWTRGWRGPG